MTGDSYATANRADRDPNAVFSMKSLPVTIGR
jgi:hypothetical protein